MPVTPKRVAEVAVVAAAYVATAKLGFLMAIEPGNVTVVWPPSGIALAAVLLLGNRAWLGVWLGSFVANSWFFAGITNPLSLATLVTSYCIAVGSTLQALLGAMAIRRVIGPVGAFERPADVFKFAGIEVACCIVAATFGVTSLSVAGFARWTNYVGTWWTWYLGDLVGVVVVTPLAIAWSRLPAVKWSVRSAVEPVALLVVGALILRIGFGAPLGGGVIDYPRAYLGIPVVVWAAWRFGQRGATLTVVAMTAVAVWGTILGFGPFVGGTTNESLLAMQAYVGIVSLTSLTLAAAVAESRRAQESLQRARDDLDIRVQERTSELRASEQRTLMIVEAAHDAFVAIGVDGLIIDWNRQAELIFGWVREEVIGRPLAEKIIPARYREAHRQGLKHFVATGEGPLLDRRIELEALHRDGHEFPIELSVTPVRWGERYIFSAFIRDITRRKRAEQQIRQSQEQLRALTARLQDVREEERTRIAREVHDDLGQSLTGLKMDLTWMDKQLAKRDAKAPGALHEKLGSMVKLVETTIQSVRRISSDLRPGVLDDLGLVTAIEWQAHDFQNRSGIRCDVSNALDKIALDRETSTAVFRIFQEVLTNVGRHARATKVNVSLDKKDKSLVLEVKDNGRGITEKEIADRASLGLLGMRERAALFGGAVEVAGVAGRGTTVRVTIPTGQ